MYLFDNLSKLLLLSVKEQKPTDEIQSEISKIPLKKLKEKLNNDTEKKTFWINLYNAYFLILRTELNLSKPKIYTEKVITIANHNFSLDDIEHGILRRYRYKYSLGYFPNFFTRKLIKELAVSKIDYRIHFALNCGAKSCPPIAFYNSEKIALQLDDVTQSFLEFETDFDHSKKVMYTTMLFKWFLGDFGGIKGIKKIYQQQLKKDISNYKIKFKPYSWEENLNNFM